MANDKKKKPRPWDKSDEDIPDVIWGGQSSKAPDNPAGGLIDPASRLPLPSMDSLPQALPHPL